MATGAAVLGEVRDDERANLKKVDELKVCVLERARHAIQSSLPALLLEIDGGINEENRPNDVIRLTHKLSRFMADIRAAMGIIVPKNEDGNNVNVAVIEKVMEMTGRIDNNAQDNVRALAALCAERVNLTTKIVANAPDCLATPTARTGGDMTTVSLAIDCQARAVYYSLYANILAFLEYITKHMDKLVSPNGNDHSKSMY